MGFVAIWIVMLLILSSAGVKAEESNLPDPGISELMREGNRLYFNGNYQGAISVFEDLYHKNEISSHRLMHARIALKLGILYYHTGNFGFSHHFYRLAEEQLLQVPGPDFTPLAVLYTNMGALMIQTADLEAAKGYYERAEEIVLDIYGANHPLLGSIYLNMGVVFHNGGDIEKSRLYYGRSLDYFVHNNDDNNISRVFHNQGMISYNTGEYEDALSHYRASVDHLRESHGLRKASSLNNIARTYNKLGDYSSADYYFQKALADAHQGGCGTYPQIAIFYLNYSLFLIEQQQAEVASTYLDLAGKHFLSGWTESHPMVARYFLGLARLHMFHDRYTKAAQKVQFAIAMLENSKALPGSDSPDVALNSQESITMLEALKLNAAILGRKSNAADPENANPALLKEKLKSLDAAVDLIHQLRINYTGETSKYHLSGREKDVFVAAVSVAYKLYQITSQEKYFSKAFAYSNMAKNAVLAETLGGIDGFRVAGVPGLLRKEESSLRRELRSLDHLIRQEILQSEPDENRMRYWEKKMFDTYRQYEDLIASLEKEYPEYYRLRYKPGVASVTDLQKALSPGQLLVEYLVGEDEIFVFAISAEDKKVFCQPLQENTKHHIHVFMKSFTLGNAMLAGKEQFVEYTEAAWRLYDVLLKPAMDHFNPGSLMIVPDELLSLLPFEAMLIESKEFTGMDYARLPFLIKQLPVSYSYSTALLLSSHPLTTSPNSKRIMAFSPVADSFREEKVYAEGQMISLPGALKEVKFLEREFDARIFMGALASRENFILQSGNAGVLHLAMHAVVDTLNPMNSRLIFDPQDAHSQKNLYAWEIYGLQLPAKLVVLSACNTGAGKQVSGEGIISFTRSFMYAGIRRIVMTLWAVPDHTSAGIMKDFYTYRLQTQTEGEALRMAKISYLEQVLPGKAHPFYWAGYVAVESTLEKREVPAGRKSTNLAAALLLLIGAGITVMIFRAIWTYIRERISSSSC